MTPSFSQPAPGNKTSFSLSVTFALCLIILSATTTFAAWAPQSIPAGTGVLYAVYFVDANVGYAVGENGTVIKTINGGADGWTATVTDIGGSVLNTVYFVDADNGWAGGAGGIYRTDNGGTSWMWANSPGIVTIDHIVFTPDGSTGFAGANGGNLYWSTDGGVNWALHPNTFLGGSIVSIEFVDNNTGFLATGGRYVYTTTNGGTTWTAVTRPASQLGNILDSSWVDSQHGWLVGDGSIELAYTIDGGASWSTENVVTGNTDFTAIHFTDTLNGWTVLDNGEIRITTDGGATWSDPAVFDTGAPLYDIFISADGSIYVVGEPNSIYTETPPITLIKQVWELGGSAPLASPLTTPIGSRLVFLIYVKNDTTSDIPDITFRDDLDNTGFTYIANSLYRNSPLPDTASDLEIFNATKPPSQGGTGLPQTDIIDLVANEYASACSGPGPCPGTTTDTLTFGATSINTNTTLDLPANSTIAFRFEVQVK
jgi:photosystem II stability/assembly factor-like uncharacterized protein